MSTDRGMDRPAVYSRCGMLPSNEKAPVTGARDTDRCYRIPSASYYVKKVMQTVETMFTMVPFILGKKRGGEESPRILEIYSQALRT